MTPMEIPETDWVEFCDRFSRENQGRLATVELVMSEKERHCLAERLPFLGLSFDLRGTRPSSLEISAGDSPDAHVSHVVDLPLRIRLAEDERERLLEVEPADGPRVLVRFTF